MKEEGRGQEVARTRKRVGWKCRETGLKGDGVHYLGTVRYLKEGSGAREAGLKHDATTREQVWNC